MIAKLVKGRGFRGALEYDITKEGGRIISSNMAGENPRELAAEFGEIRKLRPNLGKAVMHVSLSAAPGEKLTDEQWQAIGQRYLRGMGFTDNQFVMTRHTDTEHEHIHILANRITHAGEVVSDGQDYKRQETIMREIERDFRLQRVAPSIEAERKAPTKGEIEGAIRTGQPSTRQQLQQLADAAAKDCPDFTTYQERLEAAGVELVPVAQLQGAKLSGLSYRLDGVTMKGSDLGKTYTAAGIQKRASAMSKTETLRQSAAASNATRLEHLAEQMETLRQAKHQSAEDLAATLEPLAQAMAALTDETRQTLAEIERKSQEQGETFKRQLSESVKSYKDAAAAASQAAESLNQAGQRMEWRHYLLAALVGMVTAAAVTASWLFLAPPSIQNQLDPQAVAEHLKPAVIEALKPSKGR